MRVTAAFSRLLELPGIWVREVRFEPGRVIVKVALRRKRLCCPKCSYSTMARENEQDHDSVWRHLDLGIWRLEVRARLRRLRCPEHGALVEGVPFARYGARLTRDFDDLIAWLATKTDQTAICRLVRIDWETVGRIIKRVGDELLPAAADEFFGALDPTPAPSTQPRQAPEPAIMVPFGPCPTVPAGCGIPGAWLQHGSELDPRLVARASRLQAVSMDMTAGYAKSVRQHAPQAEIVIDNFHVVQAATKALDEVRREHWNELRGAGDSAAAKAFKDGRWSLLKNPEDLTYDHARRAQTSRGSACAAARIP